jgi:hypothetical protein
MRGPKKNLWTRAQYREADTGSLRILNIYSEQLRREELLRFKLGRLEHQKDLYWRQRAHISWLKGGDRNTIFFHYVASERRKKE